MYTLVKCTMPMYKLLSSVHWVLTMYNAMLSVYQLCHQWHQVCINHVHIVVMCTMTMYTLLWSIYRTLTMYTLISRVHQPCTHWSSVHHHVYTGQMYTGYVFIGYAYINYIYTSQVYTDCVHIILVTHTSSMYTLVKHTSTTLMKYTSTMYTVHTSSLHSSQDTCTKQNYNYHLPRSYNAPCCNQHLVLL